MNIQFKIRGLKEIKKIYCRIYDGRRIDISVPTNLSVHQDNWKNSKPTDLVLEKRLLKLQLSILSDFNKSFSDGDIISLDWLKKSISKAFDRPTVDNSNSNNNYLVYISDFCDWWMKNKSANWKVAHNKQMTKVSISQYQKFVDLFKDFEVSSGIKFELRKFNQHNIYSFIDFQFEKNYSYQTIERNIGRLRFFLNRAEALDLLVCKEFKEHVYIEKDDDIDGIYLNESEIEKIIKVDVSHDRELQITKDNFILGLFSGLRVSDFITNLNISDIKNGFIEIKTQKTGQKVVIPVHNEVQKVINKYLGNLPPKQKKEDFNRLLKVVCQLSEIDQLVYGKKFDRESNRKIKGYFKKYELITSHCARRSLLTMLNGKISNEAIRSIFGWSKSSNMINLYNKKNSKDYAIELNNFWRTKNHISK